MKIEHPAKRLILSSQAQEISQMQQRLSLIRNMEWHLKREITTIAQVSALAAALRSHTPAAEKSS
jgi:hypothetical protein